MVADPLDDWSVTEDHARDDVIALRRWDVDDAQWYVECSHDPEIQRFTTDRPDLTPDRVSTAIRELAGRADRDAFLIYRVGDRQRLGNLAVDYAGRVANLSYWVAPEARGAGVASRAFTLVAAWLNEHRTVVDLRLWTHVDNVASQRVAERAGFSRNPGDDRLRQIKGETWRTIGYRRAM